MYLTRDPANAEERYEFAEELSQKREFRTDPSRFAANIATESLKHGNKGEYNKLGYDWIDKIYEKEGEGRWPSINEIVSGIKKQERVQMQLRSGMNPTSDEFLEAYEGKCEAWDSYFEHITEIDHDEELTYDILESPTSQTTFTLLFLYTADVWLFKELNIGSKEGDQAKVDTLGPFARAFGAIIAFAGMDRLDLYDLRDLLEVKGTKL